MLFENFFYNDFPGTNIPDIGGTQSICGPAYSGSDVTPSVSGQCRVS